MAEVGQELALGAAGSFRPGEGQPKGQRLLLHLRDVDAEPDDPPVGGRALLDHQPPPIGDALLMADAGVLQPGQPLFDPFLLAAHRVRVVPAGHADAQGVLELAARFEKIGGAVVDLGVALVPEDVAALTIEKDDALGQGVDRFAQTLFGPPRLALGPLESVLVPPARERHQG